MKKKGGKSTERAAHVTRATVTLLPVHSGVSPVRLFAGEEEAGESRGDPSGRGALKGGANGVEG